MTSNRSMDRRIRRTRQVLQQAFIEVVREKGLTATNIRDIEKGFAATSIQDITERANVNRGTFYLHFTDKYMLLDTVVREQFQFQLSKRLPLTPRWDRKTLRLLIQAVLNIFEGKYHHQQYPSHMLAPMLERAIQEELTKLLLTWLKQEERLEKRATTSLEAIVWVVSWAIFGAAIQWSQEETAVSLDQMTDAILQVIMDGVTPFSASAIPE